APAELGPARDVVAEPAPPRVARRELAVPRIERRRLLLEPAGPEPVDEHAEPVAFLGLLVDPLYRDVGLAPHPARSVLRDAPQPQAGVVRSVFFASSSFIVAMQSAAWAKAPPARISAATQIASISSCCVAPCCKAALVCPLMQ